MKHNIAVLLSGNGSNLQAIIDNNIDVSFVVSNNPKAHGLKIAQNENIPSFSWKNVLELEEKVLKLIIEYDVKLLVLAGYMRLLSKNFVKSLPSKFIVNIHPSLLPKYKGLNTHKRALKAKEKFSGCTIHYVNEKLDAGKIIAKKKVKILKKDTLKKLEKRVLKAENKLYPLVLEKIIRS